MIMTTNTSHRPADGEGFGSGRVRIRKPELAPNPNKRIPKMKKPFSKTALGRTLAGKNKTGRLIHSAIDVLPVPNIHEVVKAVIKDEEQRSQTLGTWQVLKETFRRLDWLRTIAGVIAALVLVKGSEWVGVDVDVILEIIQQLVAL